MDSKTVAQRDIRPVSKSPHNSPLFDGERLSKLLALLSLALCWIILMGEWLHYLKPLKLRKHGRTVKSTFRYGFDYPRNIVLNLEQKTDEFLHVLQFLSGT
ncbi:hypothetical protein H6F75_16030 [Nodosilinea sp. FACHB-131]|uniref:hypothetical protein n=1 Tax=Nodosilinea sp. FACHB-131 TaxID=2692832 RepID=UPI0016838019|nr:hypothetical protein [Nodosilinea sp. FACHB-131]MBD1874997.1 hypothetical protein [Nodosilinea sp. FACHB-131]